MNVYTLLEVVQKFQGKSFNHPLINTEELNFSRGMSKMTYTKFKSNDFEDVAYFVPLYLKDLNHLKKSSYLRYNKLLQIFVMY